MLLHFLPDHIRNQDLRKLLQEIKVELFGNTICDPSGFGEGEFLIPAIIPYLGTDSDGNTSYVAEVFNYYPTSPLNYITATATDLGSNTSEFSPCQEVSSDSMPFVSGLQPASGPTAGGTPVVISGVNFTDASRVLFGTRPASYTIESRYRIVALSPPGTPGWVNVLVTNPSGTSAARTVGRFTYVSSGSGPGGGGGGSGAEREGRKGDDVPPWGKGGVPLFVTQVLDASFVVPFRSPVPVGIPDAVALLPTSRNELREHESLKKGRAPFVQPQVSGTELGQDMLAWGARVLPSKLRFPVPDEDVVDFREAVSDLLKLHEASSAGAAALNVVERVFSRWAW